MVKTSQEACQQFLGAFENDIISCNQMKKLKIEDVKIRAAASFVGAQLA
jgi:hypothetical protein